MRCAILGSRGYPSTYSGYETLVRRLAPYLRDAGHDVSVYCRGSGRPPGQGTQIDSVDGITRIWTRGVAGKATSTLSHGLTAALDARRRQFDAVLVLNVANGYYLRLLHRAGVPTVVNVDGIEWKRDKWNALGKLVFRVGAALTARYADELVADSVAIAQYWAKTFNRDCRYIPYGADVVTDVPSDRLDPLGLTPGGYVLVVARMVPENNTDLLLDALALLDFRYPAVVVGAAVGRSALEDRLRRTASAHPNFQWLGHVDDQDLLAQLWTHCGAYWHGHSVGGTNPSLLQAMGYGAPVIAVDTVYNREVLGNDQQVCPPIQGVLAARIQAVIDDADQQAALRRVSQSVISARYRWPAVNDAYEATLTHRSAAR